MWVLAATVSAALLGTATAVSFVQDALPYAYDALEPAVDAQTMELHFSKHHAGYITNLNKAIATNASSFDSLSLTDIIEVAKEQDVLVRNNGGGAYNHDLFWKAMAPVDGVGQRSAALEQAITSAFGSYDAFEEALSEAAGSVFGSGWAWLVVGRTGALSIMTSPNQDSPLMGLEAIPILGIDVWEHAYYLNYQNRRAEYIAAWMNIINWTQVSENFESYALEGSPVPSLTEEEATTAPPPEDSDADVLSAAANGDTLRSRQLAEADAPVVFEQAELPYAYDALEPVIDAQTMELHFSKHHAGYINKLNTAISTLSEVPTELTALLPKIKTLGAAVRNNGGGAYNHAMFWETMAPNGTAASQPSEALMKAIEVSFPSFEAMQEQFSIRAGRVFGSGWAWLVVDPKDPQNLAIVTTPNQDSPLMDDDAGDAMIPILGLDVWEHAYYLKYQNRRADYIAAWWGLVNWDKVSSFYDEYASKGQPVPLLTSTQQGGPQLEEASSPDSSGALSMTASVVPLLLPLVAMAVGGWVRW